MVFINISKFQKKYRICRKNTEFEMCDQKPNVCFENQMWFLKHTFGNLRNTVFTLQFDKTVFGFQKPNVCFENQMWFSKPVLKNPR